TAIFSATSCAFADDISFPTTFYDFDDWDKELQELDSASEALYPWESKIETAFFRGSCWFYKRHGRTAALTMSEVDKDLVDAAWYKEVRTDMLEQDGVPQFGDIFEAGAFKYLLHLEGHDMWSMRIRSLSRIRSLLLKQALPCQEFYYGFLRPYEHYLPIRRDLGDLFEAVLWARENDAKANAIAHAMVARARETMTKAMVLQYVHSLLTRYAGLLSYEVQLHPQAVKVDSKSACLSTLAPCGL
ncbi:lipopolysaccharide-modifying protein, partial [Baffinella frigidus]